MPRASCRIAALAKKEVKKVALKGRTELKAYQEVQQKSKRSMKAGSFVCVCLFVCLFVVARLLLMALELFLQRPTRKRLPKRPVSVFALHTALISTRIFCLFVILLTLF